MQPSACMHGANEVMIISPVRPHGLIAGKRRPYIVVGGFRKQVA
jgi:hypothetical protein